MDLYNSSDSSLEKTCMRQYAALYNKRTAPRTDIYGVLFTPQPTKLAFYLKTSGGFPSIDLMVFL